MKPLALLIFATTLLSVSIQARAQQSSPQLVAPVHVNEDSGAAQKLTAAQQYQQYLRTAQQYQQYLADQRYQQHLDRIRSFSGQ